MTKRDRVNILEAFEEERGYDIRGQAWMYLIDDVGVDRRRYQRIWHLRREFKAWLKSKGIAWA